MGSKMPKDVDSRWCKMRIELRNAGIHPVVKGSLKSSVLDVLMGIYKYLYRAYTHIYNYIKCIAIIIMYVIYI